MRSILGCPCSVTIDCHISRLCSVLDPSQHPITEAHTHFHPFIPPSVVSPQQSVSGFNSRHALSWNQCWLRMFTVFICPGIHFQGDGSFPSALKCQCDQLAFFNWAAGWECDNHGCDVSHAGAPRDHSVLCLNPWVFWSLVWAAEKPLEHWLSPSRSLLNSAPTPLRCQLGRKRSKLVAKARLLILTSLWGFNVVIKGTLLSNAMVVHWTQVPQSF